MKLDRGFRFPCVTVKKIKIEVKSTSSPDQKVKAQNSFIHKGTEKVNNLKQYTHHFVFTSTQ